MVNTNGSVNGSVSNSTSGSSQHTGSTRLSIDDILSSKRYSLNGRRQFKMSSSAAVSAAVSGGKSARSTTKSSAAKSTAKNVSVIKGILSGESLLKRQPSTQSLKSQQQQQQQQVSCPQKQKKYKFPKQEECMRRLSPQKQSLPENGRREDGVGTAKRSLLDKDQEEHKQPSKKSKKQQNEKPRRKSSHRKNKLETSEVSIPIKVSPSELQFQSSGAEINSSTAGIGKSEAIESSIHEFTADETPAAQELVSTLLSNYIACLESTHAPTANLGEEPTLISPWDVVQLLPSLLEYVDLSKDGMQIGITSAEQQHMYGRRGETSDDWKVVQDGLIPIVLGVDMVKMEVTNRNSANAESSKVKNEGNDDTAVVKLKTEARLLKLIQIQIWIRMMIWNLNGEGGWNFLGRVLEMATGSSPPAVSEEKVSVATTRIIS